MRGSLPDYFGFVRGLVDSQDLSLNISREMLQQDRQVMAIAQRIEKKITSELMDMQKKTVKNTTNSIKTLVCRSSLVCMKTMG